MSAHRCQIALPLPLEQTFTYACDVPLAPGTQVRVPFGNRTLTGVVVDEVAPDADAGTLRAVAEVLDPSCSLPEDLLPLTRWMASYYMCSWGLALRAALPPPATPLVARFVRLAPDADPDALRGTRQRDAVRFLRDAGADAMPLARVVKASGASHATMAGLAKKGIVEVFDHEVRRDMDTAPVTGEPVPRTSFSAAQEDAARLLEDAIDRREYASFLLHGVTGSGKTEVYIEALHRVRAQGRGAIVLVPEIALTPQTVNRFRRHFGDGVAVLHSRMGDGERFDAWRRIRDGSMPVVIGPRSAVLAPIPNLGLVVVDEEHESSYKQFDPAPRYHARDVALVRAREAGAVCVLGSATPSLESYRNAQTGKHHLIQLVDRIPLPDGSRARLPEVRVVDLLGDRDADGNVPVLSSRLRTALKDRLERGQQVILLQNRRGYAPVVRCGHCAAVPECPDCSVSLTWHKATRQLRCHYCGRANRFGKRCSACGEEAMTDQGAGTQKVEEVLARDFPQARVLRMDLDTTSRRDAHDRLLSKFGAGEADILVGTQMVAKGLDFERVTLVGVIDADAGLLFPDLRADERTFQLLTQVAGRAGRADLAGEVVFQTRNAKHPVIRLARRHDYETFAREALVTRQALGYPPFGRLVRIEFRGDTETATRNLADRWTQLFLAEGLPVVGPAPAFIARIKRWYRYQALVKADRSVPPSRLREALARTADRLGRLPPRTRINVDVDPIGLL